MTLLSVLVLAGATSAAPRERVVEPAGAVLVIEDGRLFRERGDARAAIGCTSEVGPGRVLDLALDPAGLVFVAAERGLYLLGPFVDVLDPVELLEGAPRGAPTSVFVDRERRVWVATADAVGVLDPSFFWGRTLTDLQLPGPYRVSGAPDGNVVIASADGSSRRYEHEAAEMAPQVTRVSVDGHETASGTLLARPADAELALDVAGDARGGATLRYRFDRHHVWRDLSPRATLALPSPGEHTLEIIALSQVLERSAPWTLRLDVAYPPHFDGRFVVGAVALGALLVLAVFLFGTRRDGALRPWRALVSTGLAVALALQSLAGVEPHAKGWPFVGFGMYTRSFAKDEIVFEEELVALLPDGNELPVRPQGAGVMVDEIWQVARPLIDGGAPAMRAFLEDWRKRFPQANVCGLQVQAKRARLTHAGPVPIAPLVLAHYSEASDG